MTQQKQRLDRPTRKQVVIHDIKQRPDIFQFRHNQRDEDHVKDLVAVLKTGQDLDRVILWHDPDENELVLVDGHHRIAAYKRLGNRKKVPALVYSCDLRQARVMALKENVKTRLPLTTEERMDAAWQLVCLDCYSRRETLEASGVSDGTVAKMRRTRKQLLCRDPDTDCQCAFKTAPV